jgi:hypothetical protein
MDKKMEYLSPFNHKFASDLLIQFAQGVELLKNYLKEEIKEEGFINLD